MNEQLESFRKQLRALGIETRQLWAHKLPDGMGAIRKITARRDNYQATFIVQTYGVGGYSLYIEQPSNAIADDVTAVDLALKADAAK